MEFVQLPNGKREGYHEAEEILAALDLSTKNFENKSVLDIGAGPCTLSAYMQLKNVNTNIANLDLEPYILYAAKMAFQQENYVVGKFPELPFADDSFDLVINYYGPALTTNHFLENGIKQLEEILRVLKPKGEARLDNPFLASYCAAIAHLYYNENYPQIRNLTNPNKEKVFLVNLPLIEKACAFIKNTKNTGPLITQYSMFTIEDQKNIIENIFKALYKNISQELGCRVFLAGKPEGLNYFNYLKIVKKSK